MDSPLSLPFPSSSALPALCCGRSQRRNQWKRAVSPSPGDYEDNNDDDDEYNDYDDDGDDDNDAEEVHFQAQ